MGKRISVLGLMVINGLILISGVFYIVYSLYFNLKIKVLNVQVPGAVFGILVLYFGIRYLMQLLNLRKEIYKADNKFSWSNFKIEKGGKKK